MDLGAEAGKIFGRSTHRRWKSLLGAVCVSLVVCLPVAAQSTASPGTLEQRVRALTQALDLDAGQQIQLEKILGEQRVAVMKIWNDSALPAVERGPATRAVQDRTAERIRGILTEVQKKRYNPPKPNGAPAAAPTVGDWMQAQTRRGQQP